jgi:hypothetical protein
MNGLYVISLGTFIISAAFFVRDRIAELTAQVKRIADRLEAETQEPASPQTRKDKDKQDMPKQIWHDAARKTRKE